MRNQEAIIETPDPAKDRVSQSPSFSTPLGNGLASDEYLSESEWDARCAKSYWQSLAETAPEVTSRKLRFDLRHAVQQLRAVFSTGTR
jgi:hypothetical protein